MTRASRTRPLTGPARKRGSPLVGAALAALLVAMIALVGHGAWRALRGGPAPGALRGVGEATLAPALPEAPASEAQPAPAPPPAPAPESPGPREPLII